MNNSKFIVTLFLILSVSLAFCQNQENAQNSQPLEKADTTKLAKSPTGAVLRSLALPGWGQYYVESYWKAPLFLAGWGTIVFFIIDNHIEYTNANEEYLNYTGTNLQEKNYLFRKKEYFRDYRDLNFLYLLGIYIVSAVDAYVGANLYEFKVDDNLVINYNINKNGNFEIKFSYILK